MGVSDALSILTGNRTGLSISPAESPKPTAPVETPSVLPGQLTPTPAAPDRVQKAVSILSGKTPISAHNKTQISFEQPQEVKPLSERDYLLEKGSRIIAKTPIPSIAGAAGTFKRNLGETYQRTPEKDPEYEDRFKRGMRIALKKSIDPKTVTYQGTTPIIPNEMKKDLEQWEVEDLYTYLSERKRQAQGEKGKRLIEESKETQAYARYWDPYREQNIQDEIVKIESTKPSIINSLRMGNAQGAMDAFTFDAFLSGDDKAINTVMALRDQLDTVSSEKAEQSKKDNWSEQLVRNTAQMLPMMGKGIALNAIPVVGQILSTSMWAQQGAGEILADMEKEGVPRDIALAVALNAGLAYALVEQLEVGQITNVGPVKDLIKKPMKRQILKLLKEKGKDWIKENLEEVGQSIIQEAAKDLAKSKAGMDIDKEGLIKRYQDISTETFKQSAGPMGLLSLLGFGGGAVKTSYDLKRNGGEKGPTITTKPTPTPAAPDGKPIQTDKAPSKKTTPTIEPDGTPVQADKTPLKVFDKKLSDFSIQDADFWKLPSEQINKIFPQLSETEQDRLQRIEDETPDETPLKEQTDVSTSVPSEGVKKATEILTSNKPTTEQQAQSVAVTEKRNEIDPNTQTPQIKKESSEIETPSYEVVHSEEQKSETEETPIKRDNPEIQKEVEKIDPDPSEAQKKAGNYPKAHWQREGLNISVETPANGIRKGKDNDGKEWSQKINHDYGYIRGTKGADAFRDETSGDQVDVFIKPNSPEGGNVFVVNQVDPKTGEFDEHKCMMGFDNEQEATEAYNSNYEPEWKGLGSITEIPVDLFKKWVFSDKTQSPLTPADVTSLKETVDQQQKQKRTTIPEAIEPTPEEIKRGKDISKNIPNLQYMNANSGFRGTNKSTGKEIVQPITYEFKDLVSGGNFTIPADKLSVQEIKRRQAEKQAEIEPEEKDQNSKISGDEVALIDYNNYKKEDTFRNIVAGAIAKGYNTLTEVPRGNQKDIYLSNSSGKAIKIVNGGNDYVREEIRKHNEKRNKQQKPPAGRNDTRTGQGVAQGSGDKQSSQRGEVPPTRKADKADSSLPSPKIEKFRQQHLKGLYQRVYSALKYGYRSGDMQTTPSEEWKSDFDILSGKKTGELSKPAKNAISWFMREINASSYLSSFPGNTNEDIVKNILAQAKRVGAKIKREGTASPRKYAEVKKSLPQSEYSIEYLQKEFFHQLQVDVHNSLEFGYKDSKGVDRKGSYLGWKQDVSIITDKGKSFFKNISKTPSDNAIRYLQTVVDSYSTEEAQKYISNVLALDPPGHTDDIVQWIQNGMSKSEMVSYHRNYENKAKGLSSTIKDSDIAKAQKTLNENPTELTLAQIKILEDTYKMDFEDLKKLVTDNPKISDETGDLFQGTEHEDKRSKTQKEIETYQREKKEKADKADKGLKGTPLFDVEEQEARATVQENLFRTVKSKETDTGVALFSKDPITDSFYSPLLKAIQILKQEKGTGEQLFNMIVKTPGVKEAEWKWIGLDDFLKGKKSVTRQEVENFVRENQVQVEEVEKGRKDRRDLKIERSWKPYLFNVVDSEGNIIKEGVSQTTASETIDSYWDGKGDSKYSEYQLPGGENYREVLLKLPAEKTTAGRSLTDAEENEYADLLDAQATSSRGLSKEDDDRLSELAEIKFFSVPKTKGRKGTDYLKSSHWEEPNVIAHTRMNDREVNGEKVLFVEEIQSDWERGARDKGIQGTKIPEGTEIEILKDPYRGYAAAVEINGERYVAIIEGNETPKQAIERRLAKRGGVPNMPFFKNWQELALKRVLRMAAEEGYDRVAWINGAQTADRYDLSKQIDSIGYQKRGEDNYNIAVYPKAGSTPIWRSDHATLKEIEETAGKDVAQRVANGIGRKEGNLTYLEDMDLKIGGEWAVNLYDKIIPQFLNKYGKKWGAKVEDVQIENLGVQQSIAITPEMRKEVLSVGQPLFSKNKKTKGKKATLSFKPTQSPIEAALTKAIFKREGKAPRHGISIVKPSGAKSHLAAAMVKDITKKDVVWFQISPEAQNELGFIPNGVVIPSTTNPELAGKIFINIDSTKPVGFLAGHELWHFLQTNPQYNKAFWDAAKVTAKGKSVIGEYVKKEGVSLEEGQNEFAADLVGEIVTEPDFWRELERKNSSIFSKIIQKLAAIVAKLDQSFRNVFYGSRTQTENELVSDIQDVRNTLHKILRSYYKAEKENKSEISDYAALAINQLGSSPSFSKEKTVLADKGIVEQAKRDIEEQKVRIAEIEKEKNVLKGKLLSLPKNLLLVRAEIGLRIKNAQLQELDQIKNAILNYSNRIGLKGVANNKVAAQIAAARSVRGLERAVRVMDEAYVAQDRREAVTNLRKVIDNSYRWVKKVESGKLRSTIDYKNAVALKAYLTSLSTPAGSEAESRLERLNKIMAYFNNYADKDFDKASFISDIDPEIIEWKENINQPVPNKISEYIQHLFSKNIASLTTSQIKGVLADIESIKQNGRSAKQEEELKEKEELDKVAAEGEVLIKNSTKESPEELFAKVAGKSSKNNLQYLGFLGKEFMWSLIRPERVVNWMSGYRGSVLKDNITQPLYNAQDVKQRNLQKNNEEFKKRHETIDFKEVVLGETITIDLAAIHKSQDIPFSGAQKEVKLNLDKQMFIYAHSQNDSGLSHLYGMFKTNEIAKVVIEKVVNALPEKYKRVVDAQIDYYDNVIYPRLNDVFNRERGIDLPKETRYFPILNLKTDRAESAIVADIIARYSSRWAGVQKGMVKLRVSSKAPFKEMSYLNTVSKNALMTEHYIAYNDAVRKVGRFLNHPKIRVAMENKGEMPYNQLKGWLKAVAYGKVGGSENINDKLMDFLRSRSTIFMLGFRLTTAAKQIGSLPRGIAKIDNKSYLLRSVGSFSKSPKAAIAFAMEKSGMMTDRVTSYEREMAEMAERQIMRSYTGLSSISDKVKRASMWHIGLTDQIAATIVWNAKYLEEKERGVTESSAIEIADEAITSTQSMGGVLYLPAIYRGSGFARAFLMFTNDLNQSVNLVFDLANTWHMKPTKENAMEIALYFLVPAFIEYVINNGLMFDEPEDYFYELFHLFSGAFPAIGLIGDATIKVLLDKVKEERGLIANKTWKRYAADYVPPPYSVFQDLITGITQGKVLPPVKSVAQMSGLPFAAPLQYAQGLFRVLGGESWRNLLWSKRVSEPVTLYSSMAKRKFKPRPKSNDTDVYLKWYRSLSEEDKNRFNQYIDDNRTKFIK